MTLETEAIRERNEAMKEACGIMSIPQSYRDTDTLLAEIKQRDDYDEAHICCCCGECA